MRNKILKIIYIYIYMYTEYTKYNLNNISSIPLLFKTLYRVIHEERSVFLELIVQIKKRVANGNKEN
jgi:hypothetical protein